MLNHWTFGVLYALGAISTCGWVFSKWDFDICDGDAMFTAAFFGTLAWPVTAIANILYKSWKKD